MDLNTSNFNKATMLMDNRQIVIHNKNIYKAL